MSLATDLSHATTNRNQFIARLSGWIVAQLNRRRTIRSLSACRQSELHDVGIITQDIIDLKHSGGADGVGELCRNAEIRSGNW